MKGNSFYQMVLREISKNNFKRMNLTAFTRLIRTKVSDVPTHQLMYIYCELQRLKSNHPQFHLNHTHTNHNQSFRYSNSKPMLKYESYEKHVLICLEQIAMKLKEKSGFEQGVDLCKLFYMRLLNVIDYHLPYVHVLERFRGEFVWRDIDEEVIDYVELIEKDPSNLSPFFVQTVNLIIQQVSEQLQNIDILQLPYLKSVLSKGQAYQAYNITDQLLERVDLIIFQNRFAFNFGQLQKSLVSDHKNKQLLEYYALMNKDLTEKRINYLFIDSLNEKESGSVKKDVKKQIGMPGKTINQGSIDQAFKSISDLSLYGTYINIFESFLENKQLKKTISLTKQFFTYHFNYFSKSGNIGCDLQQICEVLTNTLQNQSNTKQKGIKLIHVSILKLFYVLSMLLRNTISGNQLIESHSCLKQQLEILNSIQVPKVQSVSKIFDRSIKYCIPNSNIDSVRPLILSLTILIENQEENTLTKLIQEELECFSLSEKNFVMSQLIICLISSVQNEQLRDFTQISAKFLEIFMRIQFKKFSTESSNIQKILFIAKQYKNFISSKDSSKNDDRNSSKKAQTFKSFVV